MTPKVIFVDFDNTLCLHESPISYDDADILFCDNMTAASEWFKKSIPNKSLINILNDYKSKGATIILLSSSGSKQLESKKVWISNNCPENMISEFYATSEDAPKMNFIKSYCEHFKHNSDEVWLIDDTPETYNSIFRSGICKAYPPQYITEKYKN